MALVSTVKTRKENKNVIKNTQLQILALGASIGGILGKKAFDILLKKWLNPNSVGFIQSVILIIITIIIAFYNKYKYKIKMVHLKSSISVMILGLIMGIMSSFLGIGGGPINIALISYFLSLDSKTTALYSIYVILFSQISSLLLTLFTGSVPIVKVAYLIVMIVGGVLGGVLGSKISIKLTNKNIDTIFNYVLFAIIIISIYNSVHFFMQWKAV